MKPSNKTVEMEMQGTRGLPSVSFIKQALPVTDSGAPRVARSGAP